MIDTHGRAECSCSKPRRRWKALRLLLFLAGLSLALYMPYKAATQFESLQRIYGPWFLQGAVVAAAGLLFTLRPGFAARLPLILRLGVGAAALLWMRTGLACTPHLIETIQTSLPKGSFAWFHMTTQHVFLSLGVLAIAVAPKVVATRLGVSGETRAEESSFSETVPDAVTTPTPSA